MVPRTYREIPHGRKAANRGYTLIELMLVVALLALFGAATLSLVVSSGNAYKGILGKKDLDSNLRIALSYVDNKIRYNDVKHALRLEVNPSGNGKALVIEEELDGSIYETWIYQSGGKLREVLVEKGEPVEDDLGFEITDLGGFEAEYHSDGGLLHLNVWADGNNGRRELGTDITIKTGLTDMTS